MIGTNIHPSPPKTTRIYTCNELGCCQLRTPRCEGCTAHCYPQPRKALRFAPGVVDFGALRTGWAWQLASFLWALIFWCLVCGSITAAVIFVASIKGWI